VLRSIAADAPSAPSRRAQINDLVRQFVTPQPCAVQVWERAAKVTRNGRRPKQPEWVPLLEWDVDDPDVVRRLDP
jgi:hypothetical protein